MDIYTDGGCIGNPGPGGVGVVFLKNGKIEHEYQCGYQHTTNNRMEYRACIYALERVKQLGLKNAILYSDSKYVIESVTNWGHKWKAMGWKRNNSGSKKIENVDLFKTLYLLNAELNINWQWVKGHAGNVGNERADVLANTSASWPKSKLIGDEASAEGGQESLF